MKATLSMTRAQANLPKLARSEAITGVTRYNEVVAYIVPKERLESLLDTIDFLSDPKAQKAVAKFKAGKMKFYDLEDIK
jgi:PHD/YefM family antitoxin component YafN of YafNO toxin-antitoxin module